MTLVAGKIDSGTRTPTVLLHSDDVAAGEPLFTVHAGIESKLREARAFAADRPPVRINGAEMTAVERF